jgi:hypothetical protein
MNPDIGLHDKYRGYSKEDVTLSLQLNADEGYWLSPRGQRIYLDQIDGLYAKRIVDFVVERGLEAPKQILNIFLKEYEEETYFSLESKDFAKIGVPLEDFNAFINLLKNNIIKKLGIQNDEVKVHVTELPDEPVNLIYIVTTVSRRVTERVTKTRLFKEKEVMFSKVRSLVDKLVSDFSVTFKRNMEVPF